MPRSSRTPTDLDARLARLWRMEAAGQRLTQRDVAARSGISAAQISRIFAGAKATSMNEAAAICAALNISLADTLDRTHTP